MSTPASHTVTDPDDADGFRADDVRDHLRPTMTNEDPADVAVTAVDELADQAGELDRLRSEAAELQDQMLRRAAEFQNYRRRAESDRADAERRGKAAVLLPTLDVFDDLRRSLDAAETAATQEAAAPAFEALQEGVELVYRKFESALASLGVARIDAAGRPFDENEHEAILQQPAPEGTAPGTILTEVQPGYRLGDRVLRHARVIVAQ